MTTAYRPLISVAVAMLTAVALTAEAYHGGAHTAAPTTAAPTQVGGTVSCGGHHAATCAECPEGHGAAWCNGECTWTMGACAGIGRPTLGLTVAPTTAPPSAAPTTSAALIIEDGLDYCQIDANGCATDGAGQHGNNEVCRIGVTAAGFLTATQFDTQSGFDYVTIDGTRYHGSTGPNRLAVTAGSNFTWRSDGSVFRDGWTICWALYNAPTIPGPITDPPSSVPTDAPSPRFGLSDCAASQVQNISDAIAAITSRQGFILGDSVTIRGFTDPGCDTPSTIFPDEVPSNVFFGFELDGADVGIDYDLCVSGKTGRTTITLNSRMAVGDYPARMFATGGSGGYGGTRLDFANFTMSVGNVQAIGVNLDADCTNSTMTALTAAADSVSGKHDRTETIIVRGVNTTACPLSELFSGYRRITTAVGDIEPDITFKLLVTNLNSPVTVDEGNTLGEDTFINTDTGKMSLTLGNLGRYNIDLVAVSGPTQTKLSQWRMHVRQGPNGTSCGANGTPDPADDEHDIYTCICTDGFSGDNCEIAAATYAATSTGDDGDASIAIGASLGAVVFFMVSALVAARIQVYRLKHTPLDMDGIQDEVLSGLGIRLPKDIGDHEFGVSFTFDTDIEPSSLVDPGLTALGEKVVAVLAKQLPRLKEEYKRARPLVSEATRNQLLLVIPRPRGYGQQSDIPERTAASLSKLASKKKLVVGSNVVLSTTLALPRRIPRELERTQLTRIKALGEGAFGTVNLHLVNEHKRETPPYHAAVKTVKPGVSAIGDDELLREASLMAVLAHRYVVKLIGVVTAPRDLPALVVIEFCEGGTMLDHVASAGPTGLTTTERLTYASQIALGMQYISARNIVHRDVAARNVLLDAMGDCKVADLGMSASLVQSGKAYAAQYIRLREEIALRWAAPEALHEDKFSPDSDVWAYGVTIWEIFACGLSEPYDGLGNGEVGAYVKSGGKLPVPPGGACAVQIYDQLLLPCWSTDAQTRPSFGELHDTAILNGGIEDAEARKERGRNRDQPEEEEEDDERRQTMWSKPGKASGSSSPGWCRAPSTQEALVDLTLNGPSVHHLASRLVPGTVTAIQAIRSIKGHELQSSYDLLDDPTQASIWHMVHAYAKPAGEHTVCPRDGDMGCAYVDTLTAADDVGSADALLSYSWSYRVTEVSAALSAWAERTGRDPKCTRIWICSLCLNQHGFEARMHKAGGPSGPEALAKAFGDRVETIGRILPMLEPWHDPGYVKRAWCLFELYTAIRMPAVEVNIILSPTQRRSFLDAIVSGGYSIGDAALKNIDTESATASVAADLEAIQTLVRGFPGGFDTLNAVVKQHLQQWFEAQGGIKSSRHASQEFIEDVKETNATSRSSLPDRVMSGGEATDAAQIGVLAP